MHHPCHRLRSLVLLTLAMLAVMPLARTAGILTRDAATGRARSLQSSADVGTHTTEDAVAAGYASAEETAHYKCRLRSIHRSRMLLKESLPPVPVLPTGNISRPPGGPDGTTEPKASPSKPQTSAGPLTPAGPSDVGHIADSDSHKTSPEHRSAMINGQEEAVAVSTSALNPAADGARQTIDDALAMSGEHTGVIQLHFQMPRPGHSNPPGEEAETSG